jgi:glucose/arabinose dehydrogenase
MRPFLALSLSLALLAGPALAQSGGPQRFKTSAGEVIVETVAGGLENPWGLAFLPDGRMLVTERPGRLRVIGTDGRLSAPLPGLPQIQARGQGGLLDVAVDPRFSENRTLYFTFSEPRGGGEAGTSVARARLNVAGTALEAPQVVFRQQPAYRGGNHFGSRIVVDRGGQLFVALGDRYDLKEQAQDPSNHIGKVVRIRPEGGAAPGNPGREGWAPEVWSIGHRNVQAAALNPATGELWTVEHGARGGDEVNVPRAGLNYGWPTITYGRDYSGARIGEGTAKAGLEQPLRHWDPSIAPSGAAFYTGDRFPAWRGDLLFGALRGQMLVRLDLDGDKVVGEERMLEGFSERIRDVRQGPDGFIYLLTDQSEGRVLRVRPADGRG